MHIIPIVRRDCVAEEFEQLSPEDFEECTQNLQKNSEHHPSKNVSGSDSPKSWRADQCSRDDDFVPLASFTHSLTYGSSIRSDYQRLYVRVSKKRFDHCIQISGKINLR
jgi:hypothetical protein